MRKEQQTRSSEQLEQILVCSVGVLIVWLTCCFSSLRRVLPRPALQPLKCKNISMNPRQNRSVTWLQNESSSKLFIEALSTDRNHKSPSRTRICRSHCWYKFRFRLEGNFSSEWFLLRWPSVSLLSYFLTPALSCMFSLCAPVVVRQCVACYRSDMWRVRCTSWQLQLDN